MRATRYRWKLAVPMIGTAVDELVIHAGQDGLLLQFPENPHRASFCQKMCDGIARNNQLQACEEMMARYKCGPR